MRSIFLCVACVLPVVANAGNEQLLSESSFKPDQGVVILQVNWGRKWPCGKFENAQIEGLTFTRMPLESPTPTALVLDTPSKLNVDNKFVPYSIVVAPGEYALSAFDVKAARSVADVGHFKATATELIRDNKALAGTFSVGTGEIVYIGSFGLDCAHDPVPWRYYLEGRQEFERFVEGFSA